MAIFQLKTSDFLFRENGVDSGGNIKKIKKIYIYIVIYLTLKKKTSEFYRRGEFF